jgi:hypothetical protein
MPAAHADSMRAPAGAATRRQFREVACGPSTRPAGTGALASRRAAVEDAQRLPC